MRKNFVYFVLIPFILVSIVVYLFIDGWVESGLEAAGESIVGARVEIDNLKVTLSPIALQWGRMQVADPHDPWRNLFETRGVRFAMDAGQLLRGKFIIETMEVNELILGTKRTTDGSPRPGRTGAGTARHPAVDEAPPQCRVGRLTRRSAGKETVSATRSPKPDWGRGLS